MVNHAFWKIFVSSVLSAIVGGILGATYWLGSLDRDWHEWRLAISNVNRLSDDLREIQAKVSILNKRDKMIASQVALMSERYNDMQAYLDARHGEQ